MKISPITTRNITNINKTTHQKMAYPVSCTVTNNPMPQPSNVNFRGNLQATSLGKLIDDYTWFINNDKEHAIFALLKIKTTKETFEKLVKTILSDEYLSYGLLDSIIRRPRDIKHFLRRFEALLPEGSDTFLTFMPENQYMKAYSAYIDKRVKNAQSISELLSIRPDWREDVLLQKHREIYHNDNFELGIIPEEINHGKFEHIINYLRQFSDQAGYKYSKDIPPLNINGKEFKFYFFTEGRSDKNVFAIGTPEGAKYIIKLANPEARGLNKAFALGTLCKIDTYLTKNNCRNSAPFKYYSHDLNASVYDFIEHKKLGFKPSSFDIQRNIPDFYDLGLRYNDTVGTNNFFFLDYSQNSVKNAKDWILGVTNREWITVDNDHVTYELTMQPKLRKYHAQLPNSINFF